MTTTETLAKIEAEAKARAKPAPVSYGTLAPGDYHRQGDVYFLCLSRLPRGAQKAKGPSAGQLAPGETQGARHIVRSEDLPGLRFYRHPKDTPLDGPIIKAPNPFTVDHPEHGSVTLPAGTYRVSYQRQYAEELKRVTD